MAKSRTRTKVVRGFQFPSYDSACSRVVFDELHKINQIVPFCKERRAVIQAGGNVGVFPDRLAELFEKVYTFEPDPENYDCLKRNLADRHHANIKVYWSGLGDEDTTGMMKRPHSNNCGANEIVPGHGITVSKLDSVFNIDVQVDLLYLDIEGAEYKALVGGKNLIDRCKPVIVVENKGLIPEYPSDLNGSNEFREWICGLGYIHRARLQRDDVFVVDDGKP